MSMPDEEQLYAVEPPPVSRDQAAAIVAHHLSLAAAYYEAADAHLIAAILQEAEDGTPGSAAATVWLTTIAEGFGETHSLPSDGHPVEEA